MRRIASLLVVLGLLTAERAAAQLRDVPDVTVTPITHFSRMEPARTVFGKVEFLGGLDISDPARRIGGLSDAATWDHGRSLLAVGDEGDWFTADLLTAADGRLTGLARPRVGPLLSSDVVNRDKTGLDAEGLAVRPVAGGVEAFVSLEARHRVLHFGPARTADDLPALTGQPLPSQPAGFARLRWTKGLEALAATPAGHPLGEALVALSEWPPRDGSDHIGFIIGGRSPGEFAMKRRDDFDVTAAAFLPGGDLLVLERRMSLLTGPAMRLLRIRAQSLRPGALVDGEEVMSASIAEIIDNMEGLAIDSADDGSVLLTILSDDNRSMLQRTLILRFKMLDTAP